MLADKQQEGLQGTAALRVFWLGGMPRNTGKHIDDYRQGGPGRGRLGCRPAATCSRSRRARATLRLSSRSSAPTTSSASTSARHLSRSPRTMRNRAGVDVEFRHGNASSMPFDSGSFDFVYCRAAFKNFSEPVRAIDEMHRVLKPGGTALIVDLRKDATAREIDAAVAEMGLGRFNAILTRLIFKHSLLKRAYSEEDFKRMVSQTPFATCEIKTASIGMEIVLRK